MAKEVARAPSGSSSSMGAGFRGSGGSCDSVAEAIRAIDSIKREQNNNGVGRPLSKKQQQESVEKSLAAVLPKVIRALTEEKQG